MESYSGLSLFISRPFHTSFWKLLLDVDCFFHEFFNDTQNDEKKKNEKQVRK
jgi:hypothetical protein